MRSTTFFVLFLTCSPDIDVTISFRVVDDLHLKRKKLVKRLRGRGREGRRHGAKRDGAGDFAIHGVPKTHDAQA